VDQKEGLLFLNSGADRVLALGPASPLSS